MQGIRLNKERSPVQQNRELAMVTLSNSGQFIEIDLCIVLDLNLCSQKPLGSHTFTATCQAEGGSITPFLPNKAIKLQQHV